MANNDLNGTRRDVLKAMGTVGIGMGMPGSGRLFAQDNADDDHFFLFVELKGGVHWILGTDGRDPASLPMQGGGFDSSVIPFQITDQLPTTAEYSELMARAFDKVLIYPYIGSIGDSYAAGQTGLGNRYCLGFSGFPLKEVIDDMAVLRGVYMLGGFHSTAPEMFTGLDSGVKGHWSAIIAKGLADRYGSRPLDNIVMENPYYSEASQQVGLAPVRLRTELLKNLTLPSSIPDFQSWKPEKRFDLLSRLSATLNPQWQQSMQRKAIYEMLTTHFGKSADLQMRIAQLTLPEGDASLDLEKQFNAVLPLFQTKVTRVATICLGASNGMNMVDGFGYFDCHRGLYHASQGSSSANSERHHLNVERLMQAVAGMIKQLKATPFNAEKSFFDVTTVVMSTEYARPSNLSGNEAGGSEGNTNFGNGHYNQNNNYLLFGKGVRGGAWLGENDPVTQHAHVCDWRYLDPRPDDVFTDSENKPDGPATAEKFSSYVTPPPDDTEATPLTGFRRPIMARDVGRTVFEIAGLSGIYDSLYTMPEVADARVIRALLR